MLPRPRCAALLLLLGPWPVRADDFADFRIPAHQVFDWRAQVASSASRFILGLEASHSEDRRWGGIASTRISWLADSDPSLTAVTLDAAFTGDRARRSEELTFGLFAPNARSSFTGSTRTAREAWSISFGHRRYPWSLPAGASLSLRAVGDYAQSWSSGDRRLQQTSPGMTVIDVDQRNGEEWRYNYFLSAALTLGLGRVRDATGVYDVQVLEERLLRGGALARPLSRQARRKLAELMYVRPRYSAFRERAGKDLWEAIERVLREDGALREGGLDGRGILRAGEPYLGRASITEDGLPRSGVLRLAGAFVGPIVSASHSELIQRSDISFFYQRTVNDTLQPPFSSTMSSRDQTHTDEVLGGARAEWHRPIGPQWQVDLAGQVLFPLRPDDDGLGVSTGGAVYWLVADRWLAAASVSQSRTLRQDSDGFTDMDAWRWDYGVRVTHYLEDRVQLELSASELQTRVRSDLSFIGFPGFARAGQVSLALTYRFMGRFTAPALLEGSL